MLRIAVYGIALNESHHAARWADTTAWADYRLVADTGSTDDTVPILLDAGVEVAPITVDPFRFDSARNAALALLPADVDLCLSLDMDELVDGPDFREMIEGNYDPADPWTLGTLWIDTGSWWRCHRLHSRRGYRWVAPCHEVIVPYGPGPHRTVDLPARLLHRPDDRPRTSYLPMLEMAVEEAPTDVRMRVYLTRERMYRQDWRGVLAAATDALALPGGWDAERAALCRWAAQADPVNAGGWLDRGIQEAPREAEAWGAVARYHHDRGAWQECLDAALNGLACPQANHYLADQHLRTAGLNDLAAVALWNLGRHDGAVLHAAEAARCAPDDVRLADNLLRCERFARPACCVVILAWNAWDHTEACLRSVMPTLGPSDRVVVVDQGSTDGTHDGLAAIPGLTVVTLVENRGFPAGCNLGARVAAGLGAEVLVFLNSDTVVPDGWLEDLCRPLADETIVAVGPMGDNVSGVQYTPGPSGMDDGGKLVYRFEPFDFSSPGFSVWAAAQRAQHRTEVVDTGRLVGFCLAVRRDAFDRAGGFDERYGLGGYDDDDLCRRLAPVGRLVVTAAGFVHHVGHASFDANEVDWWAAQETNRALYEARWTE